MWFNILKVLGTKSGFSQLDFDNVVIEDDDDCKRRWEQMSDELSKLKIDGFDADSRTNILSSTTAFGLLPNKIPPKDSPFGDAQLKLRATNLANVYYSYGTEIPEEVYCAALDLLGTDKARKEVGEFLIFRHKLGFFDGNNKGTYYNTVTIRPSSGLASEFKRGKTVARIGYNSTERRDLDLPPKLREKINTLLPKLKEAFPY